MKEIIWEKSMIRNSSVPAAVAAGAAEDAADISGIAVAVAGDVGDTLENIKFNSFVPLYK